MGLAIFDVNSFDIAERLFIQIEDLIKHKDKVKNIIKTSIHNKFYIACRSVYIDTKMYLIHFVQEGGIIETHAPYENVYIFYIVKK